MTRGIVSFMDDYVSDPRLRAALSINSTCANLPPSKMSALGIAGLLIEGGLSIPHVKGGAQSVPEAFAHCVRANGGDILTGKLVEQILVENRRACGVRLVNSPLAAQGQDDSPGKARRDHRGAVCDFKRFGPADVLSASRR